MGRFEGLANARIFEGEVATVATATPRVFDARGMSYLNVVAGAGGTVTVSKVDTADASAHTAETVTEFPHAVEWPFYRVTATTQPARVALG